jgi:hypothetical protein
MENTMGLKHILNPILFQGYKKKNRYFEGWYYKMVSADETYKVAFIPGISLAGDKTHSFVQVFISQKKPNMSLKTDYFKYEKTDFHYENEPFKVTVGPQTFTSNQLTVDFKSDRLQVKGDISIETLSPLQKGLWMPNIMGPFGYLNFMECYHGVVSMTSPLKGSLLIDGKPVSFDGGKGYIEKDWGKSFPRAYVWLQTNHFNDPGTSFMFSYADIPFLGFYFIGLICNLYYKGKEYRFATYNFSKVIKEEISPKQAFYVLKKGQYRLEIKAIQQDQIDLASPINGAMDHTIKEGLSGQVEIKLYRKNVLIYEDTGKEAGIEIMKK